MFGASTSIEDVVVLLNTSCIYMIPLLVDQHVNTQFFHDLTMVVWMLLLLFTF